MFKELKKNTATMTKQQKISIQKQKLQRRKQTLKLKNTILEMKNSLDWPKADFGQQKKKKNQ